MGKLRSPLHKGLGNLNNMLSTKLSGGLAALKGLPTIALSLGFHSFHVS